MTGCLQGPVVGVSDKAAASAEGGCSVTPAENKQLDQLFPFSIKISYVQYVVSFLKLYSEGVSVLNL